jgi:hypothetical protein
VLQKDFKTVVDTKANRDVRREEDMYSQYQSDSKYVNNTLECDTYDPASGTCHRQTPQTPEVTGNIGHHKHVTGSGTENENRKHCNTNSPETDNYFILENTKVASGMNQNGNFQTNTCVNGVNVATSHNTDGRISTSDDVDDFYHNQTCNTTDGQGVDDKGCDNMYFVLEKS